MLNFKSRSVRRGTVFGVPAALAIGAALWIRPAARDAVSVSPPMMSARAASLREFGSFSLAWSCVTMSGVMPPNAIARAAW